MQLCLINLQQLAGAQLVSDDDLGKEDVVVLGPSPGGAAEITSYLMIKAYGSTRRLSESQTVFINSLSWGLNFL
jgi:hypothetical protein